MMLSQPNMSPTNQVQAHQKSFLIRYKARAYIWNFKNIIFFYDGRNILLQFLKKDPVVVKKL